MRPKVNVLLLSMAIIAVLVHHTHATQLHNLQWKWMSGSSLTNKNGICGVPGQYSSTYYPGSRWFSAMTVASNNTAYLFGGMGYATQGTNRGKLGDIWAYTQSFWTNNGEWAWVGGKNDSIDYPGQYAGQAAYPGARFSHLAWKNVNEVLVFGGSGYDGAGSDDILNDIWSFNLTTKTWRWVKGSSTISASAVFGTLGSSSAGNTPGSGNYRALLATTSDGNSIYIFGGYGYASPSTGVLSDTWKYDNSINTWTWVAGSSQTYRYSVGGNSGEFSTAYYPGGRTSSCVMNSGYLMNSKVYLYGGNGRSTSNEGRLGDLWAYDIDSAKWAYIFGESEEVGNTVSPSYGSISVWDSSNHPSSRQGSQGWSDPNSDLLYLFGGEGMDSSPGLMSDLFGFNATIRMWSWLGGTSVRNQPGVYADKVWFSAYNKPGKRTYSTGSQNSEYGLMFLFGGYDGSSPLNDLWATKGPTVLIPTPTSTTTATPTASPTTSPTTSPTSTPTTTPSQSPTSSPTTSPTTSPTASPTSSPTTSPSLSPTTSPTASPTLSPSPSTSPTTSPTHSPSATATPTATPTDTPPSAVFDPFGFGADAEAESWALLLGMVVLGCGIIGLVVWHYRKKEPVQPEKSETDVTLEAISP